MHDWSWRKLTLFTVLFIAVTTLVIWVAWQAEEARLPVQTRIVGETDDGNFVVEMREKESYDLIVHCNEEKFQKAFEAFSANTKVVSPYPPLRVPGGPMVIALADVELSETLQPAKRTAIEFLKRHAPRRVILVAHSECLLYDSIAAWQDHLDEVKRKQHEHLIMARDAITRWLPNTEVEIYYADKDGDRLTFHRMTEELSPPSVDQNEIDSGSTR